MAGSASGAELEYINKKKATILLHGGYQYCAKTRNKNGSVLWECTQRKKSKCTGSIIIHVTIPTFRLNNGQEIPAVGYGTWLGGGDPPGEKAKDKKEPEAFQLEFDGGPSIPYMKEALAYAIDIGYRHVDTAHVYRVEPEVGEVVNQKIKEKVIKREDIFVTTKVWQHFHREGDVEVALRGSLRRLDLDYVDMALMHWPFSVSQDGEDEKIDYLETWRGLEISLAKGLTRGIGVSNFTLEQMDRLLKNCKVPPAINQIEVNLNLGQTELVDFCHSHHVQVVAYTPLGTMIPSRAAPNSPEPKLNNPTMVEIANKYGKTVTQVVFRYLYQRGVVMIPKTITKSRVLENASIFDFHLDAEDVATIKQFDVGYRTLVPVFYQDMQNYPFEKVPEKVPIPLSLRRWKNGYKGDIE